MIDVDTSCAVVTGANAGIGKEVTAGLMKQGVHVIMACRNRARCEAARAQLLTRNLKGSAECMDLDVANVDSVRTFAANLKRRLGATQRLRVLVNNAGTVC